MRLKRKLMLSPLITLNSCDGFRNYYREGHYLNPINALIDRAQLLNLSVPEMTALVGGLRVLGANTNGATHGVFTDRVGILSNDFFVNLLDMKYEWKPGADGKTYEGLERGTNKLFLLSPVDLAFGSSAELRSVAKFMRVMTDVKNSLEISQSLGESDERTVLKLF